MVWCVHCGVVMMWCVVTVVWCCHCGVVLSLWCGVVTVVWSLWYGVDRHVLSSCKHFTIVTILRYVDCVERDITTADRLGEKVADREK